MNPISVVAVVEQMAANPAYETDFHAWTQVQAALLSSRPKITYSFSFE